jgi:hypothetical protein
MEKATYLKLADKCRLHAHRELSFRQWLLLRMAAEAWTDFVEIERDSGHEVTGDLPASVKPTKAKLH